MSKVQKLTLILLELFILLLFILSPSKEMLLLVVLIQIIILTIRNGILIQDKWFNGADWLRRTIYFIPYFIGIIVSKPMQVKTSYLLEYSLIAIVVGGGFLIPRIKGLLQFFNSELLVLFPSITLRFAILQVYSHIGSAIFQELFYKAFIIVTLIPVVGKIPAVLLSALLFAVEHFLHSMASKFFNLKEYIYQFLLSTAAGFLYIYSGSILVPILVHLAYNTPIAISYVYRFMANRSVKSEGGRAI